MPNKTIYTTLVSLAIVLGMVSSDLAGVVGQPAVFTSDLGDAPDSHNSAGVSMSAYPGVPASFPTVFDGRAPHGPIHLNETVHYYLGSGLSGEEEADSGWDEDPDGVNNIDPAFDLANQDGWDDGLSLPAVMYHCQMLVLEYTVTVTNSVNTPRSAYLNLWADWDRSGSWGNPGAGVCAGDGDSPPEWAVANHTLQFPGNGTYTLQTPAFRVWNPDPSRPMWLRLTLSDLPAAAADGSGPAAGYTWGETEDYLIPGARHQVFLPQVAGSGDPPPPPPDEPHIDPVYPPEVGFSWPQVPDGPETAVIDKTKLTLRIQNDAPQDRLLEIRLTFIVNGGKYHFNVDPMPIIPANTVMELLLPQGAQAGLFDNTRSPGYIVGEVWNGIPVTGELASVSTIEMISYHADEMEPAFAVLYNEDGLAAQMEAMSFFRAPSMTSRMADHFPADENPALISSLVLYQAADAVLNEPADDPNSMEFDDIPPPPPTLAPNYLTFYLCPEWDTRPVDNGFGEDFGLNDDGWRARGAKIKVYQGNLVLFDGWLNKYGCTAVYSNSGLSLTVILTGEARLESGGGYINIRYIFNNSTNLKGAGVTVLNPQNGGTYRPEAYYRDPMGMMSYAIQERFNGGVSGKWFYLRKNGCGNDPAKGSCKSFLNSNPIIYISPSQWRNKFIVAYEYGHMILTFTANYLNDCSLFGSGHNMKSIEYHSCAAMEGWAHFVSADIWNQGHSGSNPGAVFVYWNSSATVYDVEYGSDQKNCYDQYPNTWLCDYIGVELDWLRFWWDFHTNNLPGDPGSPPSHTWLMNLIDDTEFESGVWQASDAFEAVLSGGMLNRWREFACWNGIAYEVCQ